MLRTHIDLFTGIGGFALAAQANGVRTVAMCEIDERCRAFLSKAWAGVELHDDVRTFDGARYAGATWLLTGGVPCQPAEPGSSAAAAMTAGSGRKLSESFPLSGPLGRCSRILLASETWASPEFYLTWKVKATRCGCSVFQLAPSAPRTDANGIGSSGIWQTPTTIQFEKRRQGGQLTRGELLLAGQVKALASARPTPAARDVKGQTQNPERMDYVPNILKASWPSPQANKTTKNTVNPQRMKENGAQTCLPDALHLAAWAPPQMQDYKVGILTSGCLARTESFVVRLTTLSAWLMGYTAAYLAGWATASSRRSRSASSPP